MSSLTTLSVYYFPPQSALEAILRERFSETREILELESDEDGIKMFDSIIKKVSCTLGGSSCNYSFIDETTKEIFERLAYKRSLLHCVLHGLDIPGFFWDEYPRFSTPSSEGSCKQTNVFRDPNQINLPSK